MADQTITYVEEMVGSGHPTKTDTLNRALLIAHEVDGTHSGGPIITSKSTETTNQAIATTDAGALIELGSATAADRIFTMDSMGSGEDGYHFHLANNSDYNLTIAVSDTDLIWNSGAGYGIELPNRGTTVTLRYDHTATKFDIVRKTGGRVLIEGLKLCVPMNAFTSESDANTKRIIIDDTAKYIVEIFNDVTILKEDASKFPPGAWNFPGTDEYALCLDSADWDIFGNQTGHKTVAFWFYSDTDQTDYPICHFEDGTHFWGIYHHIDDDIRMFLTDGGTLIDMSGGVVGQSTWYHVALIVNGAESGLYLDGVQVDYDATFTVATFAGGLYIGQRGDGSFFDGRIQDLHISYNNPYGAVPVVGVTDTFTKPAAPFKGAML